MKGAGEGEGSVVGKVREAVERKRLKRDRKKEEVFCCSAAVKSPGHLLSSICAKQSGGEGRVRGWGWLPPVFGLDTHARTHTQFLIACNTRAKRKHSH